MNDILALAHRQGYITTRSARALGANEHTLGRLADQGLLVRSVPGIFLVPGERHPAESHALVTRAMLDDDPMAVASHHSALALHGVALYGVPWGQPQLADARRSSRGRVSRFRHVLRPADEVTEVDGYRTVGVPLALAQVAARYGMVAGLVALDDALAKGLCTRAAPAAIVEAGRLRRGVRAARRALELADCRAQSPGESRLRAIVAESPWRYDLQVNVGGPGSGYVVDLLVDDCVVLEFDGAVKYEGVEGKSALLAEKGREDWIRGRRYGFMRVIWAQLDYPVALRRALHATVLQTRAAGRPRRSNVAS